MLVQCLEQRLSQVLLYNWHLLLLATTQAVFRLMLLKSGWCFQNDPSALDSFFKRLFISI